MTRYASVIAFALAAAAAPAFVLAGEAPTSSTGEITVFAAASLTDAFGEIGRLFTARQRGAKITFNFAGSQQLAAQILEGAPADVFASANGDQMKRVADAGLLSSPARPFVSNALAIAVEPGNPQHVEALIDLARPGLVIVLAAEEVPAGKYARVALEKASVKLSPASLETDVRSVLAKVALGEADAGIVYRSDIAAAGSKVTGIEIPAAENVVASYPIAALESAGDTAAANGFVGFVLSEPARAVLARYGFAAPSRSQHDEKERR